MIIVIIIIYLGWSEWALQADGVAVIELEKKKSVDNGPKYDVKA